MFNENNRRAFATQQRCILKNLTYWVFGHFFIDLIYLGLVELAAGEATTKYNKTEAEMQSSARHRVDNQMNDKSNRNAWSNHRPPAATFNFSDIIEDQTIYDRTNGRIESTFNSSAMDRPTINPDSVSVDDILRNSTVHEIRDLSQRRQRTISASINESQQPYNKYSAVKEPPAYDESFRPAEEVNMSRELMNSSVLLLKTNSFIPLCMYVRVLCLQTDARSAQ